MSSPKLNVRFWGSSRPYLGLLASFLLVSTSVTTHAAVSDAEFQRVEKELAELKAAMRSLKGNVSQQRVEAHKTAAKVTAIASRPAYVAPAQAPGTIPLFATTSKQIQFGTLTITPGGFVDAVGIYRNKNLESDQFSAVQNTPFNNSNLAHVSEQRFTARGTRPALLIETPISKSMIAAAYGEIDFQGAGSTSNQNQYTGYVPRLRQAYATLDNSDYGIHFLAGQAWSLIQPNSKGITPRNEVSPPIIDTLGMIGNLNARIPQIRLVKDFDKRLWIALSLENSATLGPGGCTGVVSNTGGTVTGSQTTVPANAAAGIVSGTCLAPGSSGYFGGSGQNSTLSLNQRPDVLLKAAYEASIAGRNAHFEALGIYRTLTDYVNYGSGGVIANSGQQNTNAYGIGTAVSAEILPGKLDFQYQGTIGRGLGRYQNSGIADAAVTGNGSLKAVGSANGFAGFVAHVTPAIDIYGFVGVEEVNREFSSVGGTTTGYGAPGGFNNTGCGYLGGTCGGSGQTHRVTEITTGFSDKLYKGSFGEMRVGAQYGYYQRSIFGATANANGIATAAAPMTSARTSEQIVETSLRFYPFQ